MNEEQRKADRRAAVQRAMNGAMIVGLAVLAAIILYAALKGN